MTIKPTLVQAVRLLPRSDTAPAGRARALRGRFQDRLAPIADESGPALPDDDAAPDADAHAPQPVTATRPDAAPPIAAEPALSRRVVHACMRDEHDGLRIARLAAVIGEFVNAPAILDSGCWELQIALDPALLPATRLRLHLSSCRLSLRFESADRDARCVILDNSRELQRRLHALLPPHIDVDIACW
ncbi:type III secretion system protein SctP [Massilia sp. TW-1]|uniref:Type III secretion system protein SctP n=1 Tax=Telluria antibiotica TaxID=2717319 RepID=A0ABX0PFL7_9BURK|nr:type III secretion system protein SctP [Telluria antibiotica]NIA55917.1 type III secretion system protein SctP [Telluria antibiotica]